jgi:hypothetical protein
VPIQPGVDADATARAGTAGRYVLRMDRQPPGAAELWSLYPGLPKATGFGASPNRSHSSSVYKSTVAAVGDRGKAD